MQVVPVDSFDLGNRSSVIADRIRGDGARTHPPESHRGGSSTERDLFGR